MLHKTIFFIFCIFTFNPLLSNSATIDLNGKIYNDLGTLYGSRPIIPISAKKGESVTKSFAISIDVSLEVNASGIATVGDDRFRDYEFHAAYLETRNPNLTGFRIDNAMGLQFDQIDYAVFDLTFTPTTETIVQDSIYRSFPPNSLPEGTSQAGLEIVTLGATYFSTDGDYYLDDLFLDNFYFSVAGTVLPDSSITPVPLHGSSSMLLLGFLGLSVAARRRKKNEVRP